MPMRTASNSPARVSSWATAAMISSPALRAQFAIDQQIAFRPAAGRAGCRIVLFSTALLCNPKPSVKRTNPRSEQQNDVLFDRTNGERQGTAAIASVALTATFAHAAPSACGEGLPV